MTENGWIKVHRKLLKNPVVMKDSDHFAVWVYLLLNASRVVQNSIFDGKNVELKPGQLIIGRRRISADMKIHESKVQRILKCFESENLFKQQTSPRSRLISILKWKDYQISEQGNEQQVNNKRTTSEQQANTIQEVLELKKEEKVGEGDDRDFFEMFRRACGNEVTDEQISAEIGKFKNAYPGKIAKECGRLVNGWVAHMDQPTGTASKMVF